MQIIRQLSEVSSAINGPVVLTIGNFDGVHLGHKTVLNRARQIADELEIPLAVITFSNHPLEVLRPQSLLPRLCLMPHKIKLLQESGVDILILLTFTKELAQQSAKEFLTNIQKAIPFSHLVLGHDATFGKNKEGNRDEIGALSKKMKFSVEYLEKFQLKKQNVSSSVIRELIQKGELAQVEKLLGRKYSIYGPFINDKNMIHFDVSTLCLPPKGRYPIEFKGEDMRVETLAEITDGVIKVPANHPSGLGEITF